MIDRRTFAAALAVLSLPSVAQTLDAQATPSALADIRAAAVNHPGWLYISRRCTDAKDLAALCRSFGWTSVQEVIRFADLMGKTFSHAEVLAMTPNAAPAIDRAALPVVQWGPGNAPIHSAIQQAFRTAIVPDQSDRTYRALTHAQIVALAGAYRPRRAREDTVMDCDDYTRGYLGWLADNGYGNCSHGFLGYQAYDVFGRHLGAHAVTAAVDVDRRVRLLDDWRGHDERRVMPVAVAVVRSFIEEYHYSKSINGCKVSMAFALYEASEMVGAVLFGPLSTTAWKRYGEKEGDVVELRRLVCLDRCPRNTESWLIAKCLKVLKRETEYKVCVSYADPHHGHCGTIYQASNWNYEGQTAPDVLLQTPEGRLYHSRALRTKYNGDFKPFVKRLRKLQEDGLLTEVAVPGKHIYTYALQGKQRPTRLPYPKWAGSPLPRGLSRRGFLFEVRNA